MFSAFANIAKIPELRKKTLWTLGLLVFARVGVFIPLPGVNLDAVTAQINSHRGTGFGEFLGILDMFSGGGLKNMSIFALGIMPYISASIIFQLLTAIVPALQKVAKEGESGRRKITQWTRYSAVVLCIVQAVIICSTLQSQRPGGQPMVTNPGLFFLFSSAIVLTAGTSFLMWLGEQIDEFGLGNGISLIIQIGIVSRLPAAIQEIVSRFDPALDRANSSAVGPDTVFILFALFMLMVMAVVFVTEATRRIPMQTARRTQMGFKQQHYLPLKLNASGVIAIIFAQSLMVLPMVLSRVPLGETWARFMGFFTHGSFLYVSIDLFLIIFFSYFYTAVLFDPKEHAENFKQSNIFIPGIRPGNDTRDYLESVMNRITLAGAIFIAVIAVVPQIIQAALPVSPTISDFFGGTGLLIVVGVALDMVNRIESHMLQERYDGFLKGGMRIRGRKG
ncbi:MAG TPA: preprotein translocase subunit SecY [Planctomycetota bacterium]|nr:preprotein translocase subunit SecY [Planctomycetota bacterium]